MGSVSRLSSIVLAMAMDLDPGFGFEELYSRLQSDSEISYRSKLRWSIDELVKAGYFIQYDDSFGSETLSFMVSSEGEDYVSRVITQFNVGQDEGTGFGQYLGKAKDWPEIWDSPGTFSRN